jgi:hypothetical protein
VSGASLRPWFSVNGAYSRSLNLPPEAIDRRPPTAAGSAGIGGYRKWGMKRLGGGYTGSVSYTPVSAPGYPKWRPTQAANLTYAQQVTQRVSYTLSAMGGLSYGGFGYASGFGVAGVPGNSLSYGPGGLSDVSSSFGDPGINGVVDNEIFNGRSVFLASGASLNYMFSRRLALTVSGRFSSVRRNQGIRGSQSVGGDAQLSYRLNAKATLTAGSSYTTNRYIDLFGGVQGLFHTAGINYAISPTLNVGVSGGAGQVRSSFIGAVALPPEVAAILGVGASLQVLETSAWSPSYSGTITKQSQLGIFTLAAGRGFSMGNGVVMGGVRDTAVLNFSRAISPRIGFSLSAAGARSVGQVGVTSVTETLQGGANLNYRLVGGFGLGLSGGVRYLGVPSSYHRKDAYVGLGLTWSPGDRPFTF